MNAQNPAKVFLDVMRGIPAHHVTKALMTMTPGIDFRGCSKALMADCYVRSNTQGRSPYHASMCGLDLEKVRRRALARMSGDREWARA